MPAGLVGRCMQVEGEPHELAAGDGVGGIVDILAVEIVIAGIA